MECGCRCKGRVDADDLDDGHVGHGGPGGRRRQRGQSRRDEGARSQDRSGAGGRSGRGAVGPRQWWRFRPRVWGGQGRLWVFHGTGRQRLCSLRHDTVVRARHVQPLAYRVGRERQPRLPTGVGDGADRNRHDQSDARRRVLRQPGLPAHTGTDGRAARQAQQLVDKRLAEAVRHRQRGPEIGRRAQGQQLLDRGFDGSDLWLDDHLCRHVDQDGLLRQHPLAEAVQLIAAGHPVFRPALRRELHRRGHNLRGVQPRRHRHPRRQARFQRQRHVAEELRPFRRELRVLGPPDQRRLPDRRFDDSLRGRQVRRMAHPDRHLGQRGEAGDDRRRRRRRRGPPSRDGWVPAFRVHGLLRRGLLGRLDGLPRLQSQRDLVEDLRRVRSRRGVCLARFHWRLPADGHDLLFRRRREERLGDQDRRLGQSGLAERLRRHGHRVRRNRQAFRRRADAEWIDHVMGRGRRHVGGASRRQRPTQRL